MVTYRLASGEIFSFSIYTSVVIDVGLELYRLKRGEKGAGGGVSDQDRK